MTTLIALTTKDSVVMGCDSLGSVTKPFVDPFRLLGSFFDHTTGDIKTESDGTPILKNFNDIYQIAENIPYNHMTHITKLFSLAPLEMGVMVTGIASIGDRTIKSLMNEFRSSENIFTNKKKPSNYTVHSIANRLWLFVNNFYSNVFSGWTAKPFLEFMICGYDKRQPTPSVYRIRFDKDKDNLEVCFANDFGIAFGGQMKEIGRLVFGTDWENKVKLMLRFDDLLSIYRNTLQDFLTGKGINETLPHHLLYKDKLALFKDWDLDQFSANWGDFSEQNAIECVNFFVEIMIKSQQFSSTLPTVGGDVHIALITKDKGFRYISREEYEHEGFRTPV